MMMKIMMMMIDIVSSLYKYMCTDKSVTYHVDELMNDDDDDEYCILHTGTLYNRDLPC